MAEEAENQAAPDEKEDEMAREMAEAMAAEGQSGGESPEGKEGNEAAAEASGDKGDVGAEKENGVKKKSLEPLKANPSGEPLGNLDFILDVPLQVTVNLGNAKMQIKELLQLGQGSVVELEKMAGEPMDVYIGDKLVARGDVVVVNEKFGVRLTDIVSTVDRIQNLG